MRALFIGGGVLLTVLVLATAYRVVVSFAASRQSAAVAPTAAEPDNGTVHITLYTTKWCPVCKRAKAWMNEKGYAYEERDVESNPEYAKQFRAINARGGVPTFDIDGEIVKGFSDRAVSVAIAKAQERRATSL
jgi:glutaredoxin 3